MSKRRVVVTGLGCISPLGNSVKATWEGILAGRSGVNLIENFDTEKFSTRFAAQVKDFDPALYMNPKDTKKMDGFIQYGYAAAVEAIRDSGITATDENAARIGVAIGSGIGGLDTIEKNFSAMLKAGPRRVSPFFVPAAIINMISGNCFF